MPTNASIELGNQILQALAPNSLSTPNLAIAVQADRNRVYRQCRRIEGEGLLLRSQGGRPAIFCVDCHRAVANDNYLTCRSAGHDLRSFSAKVCIWALILQPQANTDGFQATA